MTVDAVICGHGRLFNVVLKNKTNISETSNLVKRFRVFSLNFQIASGITSY